MADHELQRRSLLAGTGMGILSMAGLGVPELTRPRMAMAAKLFEMGRLSSGMAAQLVGMDRVTFLLRLHEYGVSMIDLDEDDLESDFCNA